MSDFNRRFQTKLAIFHDDISLLGHFQRILAGVLQPGRVMFSGAEVRERLYPYFQRVQWRLSATLISLDVDMGKGALVLGMRGDRLHRFDLQLLHFTRR